MKRTTVSPYQVLLTIVYIAYFATSCCLTVGAPGVLVSATTKYHQSGETTVSEEPTQKPSPLPSDSPAALSETLCVAEEGADAAVASAVNNTLLLLPRWVRQAFGLSGWSMKVVPYDIASADYADRFEIGRAHV